MLQGGRELLQGGRELSQGGTQLSQGGSGVGSVRRPPARHECSSLLIKRNKNKIQDLNVSIPLTYFDCFLSRCEIVTFNITVVILH